MRRSVALPLLTVAVGVLVACSSGPDNSSAQAAAASAIRLAASGDTDAACKIAVVDWTVSAEGIHYQAYSASDSGAKEHCLDAFEEFGQDLDLLGLTSVASKIAAEDVVVRPPDGQPFLTAYVEDPYISVQVAEVGDQWLVNDFGMQAGG